MDNNSYLDGNIFPMELNMDEKIPNQLDYVFLIFFKKQ